MRYCSSACLLFFVSFVLLATSPSAFAVPNLLNTKQILSQVSTDAVLKDVIFVKRKNRVKTVTRRVRRRIKSEAGQSLDQLIEIARLIGEHYKDFVRYLLHDAQQESEKPNHGTEGVGQSP